MTKPIASPSSPTTQQQLPYVAVFCGSQSGNDSLYSVHARQVGKGLVDHGFNLVYGGGKAGLMGVVADSVLESGGLVKGIIPEHLHTTERHHHGVTDLVVVPDMHTRKRLLYEQCVAAIILAGGFGSMDEFFEMVTWNQLALHDKPIYVLNTAGFYTDLFQLLRTMQHRGFLYMDFQHKISFHDLPEPLLLQLVADRSGSATN